MSMTNLNAPVLHPVDVGVPVANDAEAGDVTRLRPTLDVASDFNVLVDRSIRLLGQDPCLYQKGGELVIVGADEGAMRIRKAKASQLRYLLAKHARWTKDDESCHPLAAVATCIVDRGAWEHVRALRATTTFPVLSSSGALHTAPGYDVETGVLVASNVDLHVPDEPSRDDARQAVTTLLDVVQDFTPHTREISRSLHEEQSGSARSRLIACRLSLFVRRRPWAAFAPAAKTMASRRPPFRTSARMVLPLWLTTALYRCRPSATRRVVPSKKTTIGGKTAPSCIARE